MNAQTHAMILNSRRVSLMAVPESASHCGKGRQGYQSRNPSLPRRWESSKTDGLDSHLRINDEIVTTELALTLPANRLYHTQPGSASAYLIETDPVFASYRKWLGSDYLLDALGADPATVQKRLGDGFYEQRLIAEQIAQLTGRRFLDGYANDEEQYQALMNAGLTYASEWNLIPGVALSAEQMARLTSDIVWLVEREIVLADGGTQKVLVPQVYVRVQDGDLSAQGALIAANDKCLSPMSCCPAESGLRLPLSACAETAFTILAESSFHQRRTH